MRSESAAGAIAQAEAKAAEYTSETQRMGQILALGLAAAQEAALSGDMAGLDRAICATGEACHHVGYLSGIESLTANGGDGAHPS